MRKIRKFNWGILANFSGGVNKKNTILTIGENEVIEAINVNLTVEGGLEKRGGYEKLVSGTGEIPSFYARDFGSSDTVNTIVAIQYNSTSGKYDLVWAKPDMTALPASWTTLYSSAFGGEVWMADIFNTIYIGNGVDENLKVDLNKNVYRVGIEAPTTAPSATASATSASMYGTYKYRITFLRQGTPPVESNPSPEVSVTVDGTGVDLSNIPTSSDPQVNARAIYRTTADGGTFYLLDIIQDNTTTTYTDTSVDEALSDELSFTRDPFPKAKYLTALGGRLWGVNSDGNLVYSNFLRPDEWNPLNILAFPEDKDQITGLARMGNNLVVFKENAIYLVNPSYDPPLKREVIHGIGCNFSHSIVEYEGKVFFANYNGIYALSSKGLEYISLKIEPFWRDKLRFDLHEPRAVYYPNKHQYIISATNGDVYYWLVYDVTHKGWTFYEIIEPVNFCLFVYDTSIERPIFSSGTNIYIFDYGWKDAGQTFTSRVETRWTAMKNPFTRKRIRRIYPIVYSEDTATGTIKVGRDFIRGAPHSFNLLPASVWGLVKWGDFTWGFGGINENRVDVNEHGTYFNFYIELATENYFNILGIGYGWQEVGYEKPYSSS